MITEFRSSVNSNSTFTRCVCVFDLTNQNGINYSTPSLYGFLYNEQTKRLPCLTYLPPKLHISSWEIRENF